jgi:hypothetical protein
MTALANDVVTLGFASPPKMITETIRSADPYLVPMMRGLIERIERAKQLRQSARPRCIAR